MLTQIHGHFGVGVHVLKAVHSIIRDKWRELSEKLMDSRDKSLQRQILDLQMEHRDLDEVVRRLSNDPNVDQLMLRRLKKRKLQLKDQIGVLKSKLIPDLDA